nr:MAG TPA: hypothetical protein [Caudoviricetes sp.]
MHPLWISCQLALVVQLIRNFQDASNSYRLGVTWR